MGNYGTKFICYDKENFNNTQVQQPVAPQPSAPPGDFNEIKKSEDNIECDDPVSFYENNTTDNKNNTNKNKVEQPKTINKTISVKAKDVNFETVREVTNDKRIKPNQDFANNSNMKTIILLNNLSEGGNNINNKLLLDCYDRAIIDRRHIYIILKSGTTVHNYIYNYTCNMEFLLGLKSVLQEINYQGFSTFFTQCVLSGLFNRIFDKDEKIILGQIIMKIPNGYFGFKNKLLEYL